MISRDAASLREWRARPGPRRRSRGLTGAELEASLEAQIASLAATRPELVVYR